MAETSTIAEGLENLGTLKQDGNGSVYKARRNGDVITAVKVLPVSVNSEDPLDKKLVDFKDDLLKLKQINKEPNPNIVRILNSGITDSGNCPYIEMEFIEGPDLETLLKAPGRPVFPLTEVIKVAEHLSNALAHWHRHNLVHGNFNIKSIKFNNNTGNYVLVDLGLPVMSLQQINNHLQDAESVSPEQREGNALFQSDVYGFGVILFQLLTGNLPEAAQGKSEKNGEAAAAKTNGVSVAGIQPLRQKRIPHAWPEEKKLQEMAIPNWLVSMVNKCLEKNPADRFANGMELQQFIKLSSNPVTSEGLDDTDANVLQEENRKLKSELDQLKVSVEKEQFFHNILQKEVKELRAVATAKDKELQGLSKRQMPVGSSVSRLAFYSLLLVTALFAALAAYFYYNKDQRTITPAALPVNNADTVALTTKPILEAVQPRVNAVEKSAENKEIIKEEKTTQAPDPLEPEQVTGQVAEQDVSPVPAPDTKTPDPFPADDRNLGQYKVISKAYFHSRPSDRTRRRAFIIHWNNAVLTARDEKDGFIYVVFTNHLGQTSKGWLAKKDLIPVDE